jgi:hypothetical protein
MPVRLAPCLVLLAACGARTEVAGPLDPGAGGAAATTTTTTPTSRPELCGYVDDSPPGWSTCVNATTCFGSCDEYCHARGMACRPSCTTSRGYVGWAAEAWVKGVPQCGGDGAGQIDCDFHWDDEIGDAPRWRCCCQ